MPVGKVIIPRVVCYHMSLRPLIPYRTCNNNNDRSLNPLKKRIPFQTCCIQGERKEIPGCVGLFQPHVEMCFFFFLSGSLDRHQIESVDGLPRHLVISTQQEPRVTDMILSFEKDNNSSFLGGFLFSHLVYRMSFVISFCSSCPCRHCRE